MRQLLTDASIWVAVLGFVFGMASFALRRLSSDRSVNNAILAEMHRVREAVRRHKEFWEGRMKAGATMHHPLIPFAHLVYDSQIANVGVVNRNRVEEVVRFFGYVDYINRFQALRPVYANAGFEDEFNGMYLRLLTRLLDGKS
jgi:hypothetical protein